VSAPLATLAADATRALETGVGAGFAWLCAGVMAVTVTLSVRAWLRARRRASMAALELLRVLLVAAILFALAGPEIVTTENPDAPPLVAVLFDDTKSMETRDVETAGGDGMRSRASVTREAVEAITAEDGPLAGLGADVVASPLSGAADASEAGTDLSTPLAALLEDPALRTVVLLSDGDWNQGGRPDDVAERYRLADVPILTRTIGLDTRLPDVALEPIDPPAFAVVGRPIEIPFTISSAMPRDVSTSVTLRDAEGVVDGPRAVLLGAQRDTLDRFTYLPTRPGRVELSVEVGEVAGELDAENNVRTFDIDVREERLRVLLVESFPRWEYRYLRNALQRDPGVDVECYLTHPPLEGVGGGPTYLEAFPPREALSGYDVVFVGDVGVGVDGITAEQCAEIAGLVRDQASGLILMPGLGGGHAELADTELGELFPVELDAAEPGGHGSATAASLALTDAGARSALTRLVPSAEGNADLWGELPGFQWHAAVVRAKAGAQVLAVHETREGAFGRLPLLVTRTARTGKVLFMGTDAAWRWREGYEDRYHYRFWGQVIRWMAYQRNMNAGETMRLFFAPDRPRVRSAVALNVNVMDASGAPLEGATVRARIESPSGRVETLRFEPAEAEGDEDSGAWGLYGASFRPLEPGRHVATLECEETGATLDAEIPVIGEPLEQRGRPARRDVMDEIARLSRGAALEELTADAVAEAVASLPPPEPIVSRSRLWAHPLFGALVAFGMALLWVGRKLVGRV